MVRYFLCFLFVISGFVLFSQELSEEDLVYNSMMDEYVDKFMAGDPTGLLDLGEFLADEQKFTRVGSDGTSYILTLREVALSALYYKCYFRGLPYDPHITRETYEAYIEENVGNIFYFPRYERFTDVDVINLSYPFRLREALDAQEKTLRELKKKIKEKRKREQYVDMIPLFWQIGALETRKAERYLLACARGRHWGMEECEYKEMVLSGIAFALGNFRTEKSLKMLLQLASDYQLYGKEDWLKAITRITNRDLYLEKGTFQNITEHYQRLWNEHESIESLRESGYKLFRDSRAIIGDDPMEMVEKINHEWWIFDNMRKDLIEEQNPLILKLTAIRMFNQLFVYNDKSGHTSFSFAERYKWALKECTYEDIRANKDQIFSMIAESNTVKKVLVDDLGFYIVPSDRENPEVLRKAMQSQDHLTATYHTIKRVYDIKNQDDQWDYEKIYTLLKYGNTIGFVGHGSRNRNELYNAVKFLMANKWREELKAYAQTEYPDKDYDNQKVMLSYMEHAGLVPWQEYVPPSFSQR